MLVFSQAMGGSPIGFSFLLLFFVVGLAALFIALLSNRRTRLLGAASLALCVFAGIAVFTYAIANSALRAQQRVQAEFRERNDLQRAIEKAELNRQLEKLNQPRIDLDTLKKDLDNFAKAEPINEPPLVVTSKPPSWGNRPSSDYKPDSDFGKKLFAEYDADWITIRSPRTTQGLDRCLAVEQQVVLNDARRYVEKCASQLGEGAEYGRVTELGMSTAEIFKRFVKERLLVEQDGEQTIYNLLVIKKDDGGTELVARTLLLHRERLSANGRTTTGQKNKPSSAPLPDWVTNPPKRVGKTVRLVLETGPYTDAASARQMADEHIWVVANRYAADVSPLVDDRMTLRGADGATNFSRAELRSRLVRDEHLETVDASFGEMKTLHTLVEISPADGNWLVSTREQSERTERLQAVSMIAAGVLGLVGLAFGLLKADELTRGYYTKRLLVGVPVAIVVLAFLASFLIAEGEAVRLAPPAPADGYRLDR